jgi:hypothetical protein
MVNANGGESDNQDINAGELEKPRSDATSDETLSDLEDSAELSSSEPGGVSSNPAPDGEFDERRDESEDAGLI